MCHLVWIRPGTRRGANGRKSGDGKAHAAWAAGRRHAGGVRGGGGRRGIGIGIGIGIGEYRGGAVPATDVRRIGMRITTRGDAVTLRLAGDFAGPVVFDLPAFVHDIASASAGTVDNAAGTVTVPAHVRSVTVTLAHAPTA